jgi:hypothetical protein
MALPRPTFAFIGDAGWSRMKFSSSRAAQPRPGDGEAEPTQGPWTALAALERDLAARVTALETDPKDRLAAALARLGRAFMAKDT